MKTTFSTRLVNCWKLILTNKKQAGIIFLYQFTPPLLFFFTALVTMLFVVFVMPLLGINLKDFPIETLLFRLANPVLLTLLVL